MRPLYVVTVAALLILGLGVAPIALAQQHMEHPVGQVRCEKLPAASTPEIAKIFADELQEPSVCPAGKFPRRYGTGEDMTGSVKCVRARPENTYDSPEDPVDDPRVARSLIDASKRVVACPPDFVVQDTDQTPPPWHDDPKKSPFYGHITTPEQDKKMQEDYEKAHKPNEQNGEKQQLNYAPLAAPSSPLCSQPTGNPAYYCYVKSAKSFAAGVSRGISGYFSVDRPYVAQVEGAHSVAQTSVGYSTSTSPSTFAGTVEMGWIVTNDPIGNTDGKSPSNKVTDFQSHLFVFWSANSYVNGSFNQKCGSIGIYTCATFVPKTGGKFWPGITLNPGDFHTFSSKHLTTAPTAGWHLYVDSNDIGYYPDYIWGGQFTSATNDTWQGEVASNLSSPTTGMGSGRYGDDPSDTAASVGAARYYDQNLVAQSFTPDFVGVSPPTATSGYHIGPTAFGSYTYGGPGAAATAAYVPAYTRTYTAPCGCWQSGTNAVTAINNVTGGAISYSVLYGTYGYEPFATAISPDGSTLFLDGGQEGPSLGNFALLVLDTATMAITATIDQPVLAANNMLTAPDGHTLYVPVDGEAYPNTGAIYPISNASGAWTVSPNPIATGLTQPEILTISSDGSTLFASENGGMQIAVINTGTNSVRTTVSIPISAYNIIMRPDQAGVYILNPTAMDVMTSKTVSGVTTYSVAKSSWTNALPTGSELMDLAFLPDSSRLYFSSCACSSPPAATTTITEIDTATGGLAAASGLTNPIVLPTSTSGLSHLAISADGATLFVALSCTAQDKNANCIENTIYQFSTSDNKLIATSTVPGWTSQVLAGNNWSGGRSNSRRFGAKQATIRPTSSITQDR